MNTETQNLPSFKVFEDGLNSKQPSSVLAPRSVVVWRSFLESIDGLHSATIEGPSDASMWLNLGNLQALRFECWLF